jgi:hypothetical protein
MVQIKTIKSMSKQSTQDKIQDLFGKLTSEQMADTLPELTKKFNASIKADQEALALKMKSLDELKNGVNKA